jgi:hypothetical protein
VIGRLFAALLLAVLVVAITVAMVEVYGSLGLIRRQRSGPSSVDGPARAPCARAPHHLPGHPGRPGGRRNRSPSSCGHRALASARVPSSSPPPPARWNTS